MRRLVGEDARQIASDFDISASTICWGDVELALSLSCKAVYPIDAYPFLNNQKPRQLQFGKSYWCQPIITMHHTSPEEANNLWQFELSRVHPEASSPLLYVTPEVPRTNGVTGMQTPLFFEEVSSHITAKFSPKRADWNNMPETPGNKLTFKPLRREKMKRSGERTPPTPAWRPAKILPRASNTFGTAQRVKYRQASSPSTQ
jgi:hypothetical protein